MILAINTVRQKQSDDYEHSILGGLSTINSNVVPQCHAKKRIVRHVSVVRLKKASTYWQGA